MKSNEDLEKLVAEQANIINILINKVNHLEWVVKHHTHEINEEFGYYGSHSFNMDFPTIVGIDPAFCHYKVYRNDCIAKCNALICKETKKIYAKDIDGNPYGYKPRKNAKHPYTFEPYEYTCVIEGDIVAENLSFEQAKSSASYYNSHTKEDAKGFYKHINVEGGGTLYCTPATNFEYVVIDMYTDKQVECALPFECD